MVRLGSDDYTYEVSGDEWGDLPQGWLYDEIGCLAVDSHDNLFVFSRGEHKMIVLDRDGNFLRSWGEDEFNVPHGLSVDADDNLYAVDCLDHTIKKFTPEGKLLMTIGESGKPSQRMSGLPFCGPTQVGIDPRDQHLYVSDGYSNARVHKYTPEGKLLFSWGEPGTKPGQFCTVHKITVDKAGFVYVADRENLRVQVFDENGKFQQQWNDLAPATAVYADNRQSDPIIYVLETYGGLRDNVTGLGNWTGTNLGPRVSIFQQDGTLVGEVGDQPEGLGVGQLSMPHAICVDSRGDIYVGETPYRMFGAKLDPPTRDVRCLQKFVRVGGEG